MSGKWLKNRELRERLIVTGQLTLETPTHVGNGDGGGLLDMPLHLDALEGRALLTGTALAGALRNYVRQVAPRVSQRLFGDAQGSRSVESLVIIDDALGMLPVTEVRDGVAIDPKTRTAADDKKYDIELLAAGTTFPLSFELLVPKRGSREELFNHFAYALQGLEQGAIHLGKRKRRGFGRCRASHWQVQRFDMTTPQGLIEWLRYQPVDSAAPVANSQQSIVELLGAAAVPVDHEGCRLEATFMLDGSLLIRSEPDSGGAEFVHLHSRRGSGQDATAVPVLSGTSLAGALRARAIRIANALGKPSEQIVDELFGKRLPEEIDRSQRRDPKEKQWTASRLWVQESVIQQPLSLIQSRVKIDRFTGGSYPGALFAEEPVFGQSATRVTVRLALPQPKDEEIGLLLLLLKDLWTGDLPLGGGSNIGRGQLKGERATLTVKTTSWTITTDKTGRLAITGGTPATLEAYVKAFVEKRA
ncbi:MAG: hypothetical protein DCC55_28115 [Chloroflexi bacterium]|nr:MAG: hypothetical protein DCC55_28115 [Chloroflexota bacterium]